MEMHTVYEKTKLMPTLWIEVSAVEVLLGLKKQSALWNSEVLLCIPRVHNEIQYATPNIGVLAIQSSHHESVTTDYEFHNCCAGQHCIGVGNEIHCFGLLFMMTCFEYSNGSESTVGVAYSISLGK